MRPILGFLSRRTTNISAFRRCSSNPSSSPSKLKDLLERVKDFFMASEKETFHADFIRRCHQWDKVKTSEWTLIYRDQTASRTFSIMAISCPLILASFIFFLFDVSLHPPKDRAPWVQRLVKDANQLGVFICVPAVAAVIVTFVLLRIHSLRVLRIYEKKGSPEEFMAVVPSSIVNQSQMQFLREDAIATYIEHENDMVKLGLLFTMGNIQISRRRWVVDDDSFRANNYRTYMLNETSVPPRL